MGKAKQIARSLRSRLSSSKSRSRTNSSNACASSTSKPPTQITSYNDAQTSSKTKPLTLNNAANNSSWSFVCRFALRTEPDDAQRGLDDGLPKKSSNLDRGAEEHMESIESINSSDESRTLSLSTAGRSSRSFACRLARRVERDYAERECSSSTALFRDVGGWGVAYFRDDGEVLNGQEEQNKPKKDVHNLESTTIHHKLHHPHGKLFGRTVQDSSVAPAAHMERAPSFTNRSTDSCDDFLESIGLPTHACPTISDEEFEALPDWSDVADDSDFD